MRDNSLYPLINFAQFHTGVSFPLGAHGHELAQKPLQVVPILSGPFELLNKKFMRLWRVEAV